MKGPMQFAVISRNTRFLHRSVHIPLDNEPFGLQELSQIDRKLQAYTERISSRDHTVTSNRSASSFNSGTQMINTYASLIQQMIQGKQIQQFCTTFGVPYKELEKIQDTEQREQFIIVSMSNHIKQLVQNFINKVQLKEHEYKVEDWQDIQRLKRNEKTLNIFEWLDVKSKYLHLRKKLQYALISSLTDEQNKGKIQNYFTERKSVPGSRAASVSTNLTRNRQYSHRENLQITPKVQITDLGKLSLNKWDQVQETSYKQNGKKSAAIGLYPVIQKEILNNVGQSLWSQQREILLTKYTEGGCLTAEEVKFISNTSTLLNECADKQFLQKTIQYLDKQVKYQQQQIIETIEYEIAESVLNTYNKMQKEARNVRKDWLKEQNQTNQQEQKLQKETLIKKIESQMNQKKLMRIKQKIIALFREVNRKNDVQEQEQEERDEFIRTQTGTNKIILKFKDKMLNAVQKLRNKQKFALHQKFIDRNIPKRSKLLFKINKEFKDTEEIKRLFHPPSKAIIGDSNKSNIEIQKFKIPIHNNTTSQIQFKRYISGGPMSDRQYSSRILRKDASLQTDQQHPNPHQWITPEIEVVAINKIKASIRAYIQKKKYKKLRVLPQSQVLLDQRKAEEKKSRGKEKKTELTIIKHIQQLMRLKRPDSMATGGPTQRSSVQRKREEMKLKTRKLFQAAQKKCLAIALQSGFLFSADDVNFRDEFGRTPLSYSAENGDEQICIYFLSYKANVNIQCNEGNTPLHYAFRSNNEMVIVRFLNHGGDLNVLNKNGLTPLAFGSENTLRKLNLIHLVSSTLNKNSFDNNASINRKYPKVIEPEGRAEFEIKISRFD